MGHPVEIFTSPPPDSCICAICHDVLKDAVGINCGHSFCEECAKACLSSGSCPNCRADFTSYVPNYTTREFIGSMAVKCPHGQVESSKRARGNDGEAVSSENEMCDWTGKCQDLQTHENVCQIKIVECSIDGCYHKCRWRDMASHLSGDGFVLHMNLMKQSLTVSFENKIDVMKQSHKREIETLERKQQRSNDQINTLKRKVTLLESKVQSLPRKISNDVSEVNDEFLVDGCGFPAINGIYQKDGYCDETSVLTANSLVLKGIASIC